MGTTSLTDAPGHHPSPTSVAAGTFALLLVVLAVSGSALLADGDTLWHLATGEWILENGQLPRTDPFSWTATGEPWIAKEWLSQLLLVTAERLAGWNGVVLLAATASAAAFAVLAAALFIRWGLRATVVAVAVAFVLSAPHLLARPHVLALPVEVLWTAVVVWRVDHRRPPPWWSLGLVVLWANLHAGVALAIVLAAAMGLDAVVRAAEPDRRQAAARWAVFVAATTLAACATPYGVRSLLVTLDVLGLGPALAVIPEWQPQDFSTIGAFEVVLLAAFGAALVRGVRLPVVRVLVLLGLLHLALSSTRNGELLGLLAPLVLAAPLGAVLGPDGDREPSERVAIPRRRSWLAVGGGVVAAVVAVLVLRPVPPAVLRPEAALDAVLATGSTRLLHEYGFGGFLVAEGVPTFVDGRTELFGGPFVAAHAAALALDDVDLLDRLLVEWEVDVTLLRPGTPAVDLLHRSPAWRVLHADRLAVVHGRVAATPGLGLGEPPGR